MVEGRNDVPRGLRSDLFDLVAEEIGNGSDAFDDVYCLPGD